MASILAGHRVGKPKAPRPDWDSLLGGISAEAWDADRLAKSTMFRTTARDLVALAKELAERGALHHARPEVLVAYPESAEWYVALAGFSQKALRSTPGVGDGFGMSVHAATIQTNLRETPRRVSPSDLRAWCAWVNHCIDQAVPEPYESPEAYPVHVAAVRGGRIVGRRQNEAGEGPAQTFKRLMTEVTNAKAWEYRHDGAWKPVEGNLAVAVGSPVWRHGPSGTVFDFTTGGNRPDVKVTRKGMVLLAAELKSRKDLSNVWESWMPQLAMHVRTWTKDHPDAVRGVFGTVFTKEMVEGQSKAGTTHVGLRGLHKEGFLDMAINLGAATVGEGPQFEQFGALVKLLTKAR